MMHRIMQIHIIHIIRWSQHILTIVSRFLFCRSCSESCGGRPLFQRVSTCVSLASVSCFQQPLQPSFNTLFQHPLSPPPPQSLRVSITVPLLGSSFLCLPLPPPSYRCRNHCSHSHSPLFLLHIAHCTFSTTSTTHFTQQHNDVPYFYLIDYHPQQMVPFKRVH